MPESTASIAATLMLPLSARALEKEYIVLGINDKELMRATVLQNPLIVNVTTARRIQAYAKVFVDSTLPFAAIPAYAQYKEISEDNVKRRLD
ncbi:MAG TPA: hypothetical protein VN902_18825 [Candidatus Acidoferrales bacterium]|nr:hypothetical protein [Candidatus Acidoferrales bacterium]